MSDIIKYHDNPIKSAKEDILGRAEFSKHLAGAILNWGANLKPEEKESLVIGINAEWGSGKSSVINMTEKELENNKNVVIIKFNPWAFSNGNNLGSLFFTEISTQLKSEEPQKFDALVDDFMNYGAYYIDGSLITAGVIVSTGVGAPDASSFIAFLFQARNIIKKMWKERKSKLNKSEKELRDKLRKELIKQGKKIVVVIDDIDRLTGPEIKQILRLIRVNGDFPNMIYVLAFDRLVVENLLSSDNEISGKDYLEKIVQVNLQLPTAKDEQIKQLLEQEMNMIKQGLPEDLWKYFERSKFGLESNMTTVLGPMCGPMFKNIRDVKRFVNSLNFKLQQVCNKEQILVNPVDFAALEAIRLFVPTFYQFIKDHKKLITSKMSINQEIDRVTGKVLDNPVLQVFDRVIQNKELSEVVVQESFKDLINKIFRPRSRVNRKICDGKFFDSYFTFQS